MKAINLTAYGNSANPQMVEISEPAGPTVGEALVRMEYAPVDYSDLLLANGVYFLYPQLPSVIGGEGAGIVEAIGPGVKGVKVGDRVTTRFGHSPGLKRSLLRPTVFLSFPPQLMPGQPQC
jgi:NADPH:quinone reductase-like Zn-dependent oxidoreductase